MNQVKYLIYASLLIAVAFTTIFFIGKISSATLINDHTSVIIDGDLPVESVVISRGKSLFQQNCQSCHALDKKLTGPALRAFTERGPWGEKKNIYAWVHNPAAFMERNKYTQNLKTEYGSVMQAFPNLTKDDVDAIIDYTSAPPGIY